MATLNFLNASVQGTRTVQQPVLEPGQITVVRNYIDCTQQAIDAGAGDVAQVVQVPAETLVLDCFLQASTAETADATCDLGYGSDADYWGANLNLDVTGVVPTVLTGSTTWDAASIATAAEEAKDITVAGASLGDLVSAIPSIDVTDLVVSATVTAEDTVTVVLANNTGVAVDLASMTMSVVVDKGNKRGQPLYFSSADTIDITAKTTNGDVDIDGFQGYVIATMLSFKQR
jgi:hypothetical protein